MHIGKILEKKRSNKGFYVWNMFFFSSLRQDSNSNSTKHKVQTLRDSLNDIYSKPEAVFHFRNRGTLPPLERFFLPWNGSLVTIPRNYSEQNGAKFNMVERDQSNQAAEVAEVILMPSPGERFLLDVGCFDQVLNEVNSAIFLEVIDMDFNFSIFQVQQSISGIQTTIGYVSLTGILLFLQLFPHQCSAVADHGRWEASLIWQKPYLRWCFQIIFMDCQCLPQFQ